MKRPSKNEWLAGVDGCSGGWIAAFARADGEVKPPRIFTCFDGIAFSDERPAIIAVDVPIGLPERSPVKGRLAESAVRSLLGDRKSSVFRVPSRSAVEAAVTAEPPDDRERFLRACEIARQTSEDGKAFSKQGFYILDKVVEVDRFLRRNRDFVGRVFETHPELAFVRMNGGRPLHEPKKVRNRNHPPGLGLRRKLLATAGIPHDLLAMKPPIGAADDDWIDALACLVTAQNIHAGCGRSYPEEAPCDAQGLPMAIWA